MYKKYFMIQLRKKEIMMNASDSKSVPVFFYSKVSNHPKLHFSIKSSFNLKENSHQMDLDLI